MKLRKVINTTAALLTIGICNINSLLASTGLSYEDVTTRIDDWGSKALGVIQGLGYWAAVIFAAIDVIMKIKKQDVPGIIAILAKYLIVFGMLYALPAIFDLIKIFFAA